MPLSASEAARIVFENPARRDDATAGKDTGAEAGAGRAAGGRLARARRECVFCPLARHAPGKAARADENETDRGGAAPPARCDEGLRA